MVVLYIPDILAALDGMEIKCQPNEQQITKESNEWLQSYNLMPAGMYNQFVRANFPLLAALCYPDANDVRLRISSDYTSILFTYDDLMDLPEHNDESIYMHRKDGVIKASEILMRVFTNQDEFKPVPGHPVINTFHDFWLRYVETSTPQQQKRFIDTSFEYVRAAEAQVVNRVNSACPTIDDYIHLRRHTSAIRVTYVLVEYVLEIDVPDVAWRHPAIEGLSEAANDILSWANDIYSFNNEQARGDCHNIVAVVALNLDLSVQAAIDYVFDMILTAIKRYWDECAKVPSFGPEIDPIVKKYVKGVEVYLSGSVDWHIRTERYFGSKVWEVRRSLKVDLNPPEPGVVSPFKYKYDNDDTIGKALDDETASRISSNSLPPARVPFSSRSTQALKNMRGKLAEWILATTLLLVSVPLWLAPVVLFVSFMFLPGPPASRVSQTWQVKN